jgi:hypothetical protein
MLELLKKTKLFLTKFTIMKFSDVKVSNKKKKLIMNELKLILKLLSGKMLFILIAPFIQNVSIRQKKPLDKRFISYF